MKELGARLAREAGQLAWSKFKTKQFVAQQKSASGDLVTEVDHAAEKIIVDGILSAYPDHAVHSEECGLVGTKDARVLWVVDPLDGTNNFAIGIPLFGVGISVFIENQLALSFIYHSPLDQLYVAEKDKGATVNGAPLKLSPLNEASKPLTLGWAQGHVVNNKDEVLRFQIHVQRNVKRLLRFWAPVLNWALIAEGQIDGMVVFDNEAEDLYPGILLLQEAGGLVMDFEGKPFSGKRERASLIGCHPARGDAILKIVRDFLHS